MRWLLVDGKIYDIRDDAFLSSPRAQLVAVPGDEVAAALRRLWGGSAPPPWNRNRAAVVSRLTWCDGQ